MARPFEDLAGSAVMPKVKAVLQPDWLLDDLELRMTRCVPAASPVLRIGTLLPAGESLHRVAAAETRSWWLEMGLSDSDEQNHRMILDALMARSPVYLGWATVPLLSGYMRELRDLAILKRMVEWVTADGYVDRLVRDAVALSVVAPWLQGEEPALARDAIETWVQSDEPAIIRMGLIVSATYAGQTTGVNRALQRTMLDACWAHASRVDSETAVAVGWALRELLRQEQERVLPEIRMRIVELSRQAMRTAVEGLSREFRVNLTLKWRQHRAQRSARITSIRRRSGSES